jgi:hypothetical protein
MADFKPKTLTDSVNEFSGGQNRGVKPILLAKNVLAGGVNVTIRGTFPTHRPAFKKVALTFSSPEVQAEVEAGVWNDGCAYDPDNEAESLVAALTGKLYQFIPAPTGYSATVQRQSAATTQQAPLALAVGKLRLLARRHFQSGFL